MAERSALSKMLNGDGPAGPSGSSGASGSPDSPAASGSNPFSGGSSSSGSAGPGNLPDGGSTPGSSGGGSGQAVFTASAIRALGGKVAALAPMLENVSRSLEDAEVEAEAWSGGGVVLANVYPQVWNFAKDDVKSKSAQLDQIAEKLKSTASTWEQAEQSSTVQPQK